MPGRDRKQIEADVGHLRILSTVHRRKTTADLQEETDASRSESEKVSRPTVSRRLKEQGLKRRSLLMSADIQKHLDFAREHKQRTADDWKKVLWMDKSKFELFSLRCCAYVHRKAGERFDALYQQRNTAEIPL